MHLRRTEPRSLDETAQAGRSRAIACGYRVPVLHRQRSRRARAALRDARGEQRPSLRLRLARAAQASLFGRSLCREGLRPRALRAGAPARRPGLLALWRRGARQLARARISSWRSCRATHGGPAAEPASTLARELRADLGLFPEAAARKTRRLSRLHRAMRSARRGAPPRPRSLPPSAALSPAAAQAGERPARADRVLSLRLSRRRHARRCWRWRRRWRARLRGDSVYVSSLKDAAAARRCARRWETVVPDVILNATAFSARRDGGTACSIAADAPVLQVISGGCRERGMGGLARGARRRRSRHECRAAGNRRPHRHPRDLVQGGGASAARREFAAPRHRAEPSRVAFVAELAAGWAGLRRKPNAEKKLALILSDYPAKGGRTGYAVGLDTRERGAIVAALVRGL